MPVKKRTLQGVRFPASVFRSAESLLRDVFNKEYMAWYEPYAERWFAENPDSDEERHTTMPPDAVGLHNFSTLGADEEWTFDDFDSFLEEVARDTYYMASFEMSLSGALAVGLKVTAWSSYVEVEATHPDRAGVLKMLSPFEDLADKYRLPAEAPHVTAPQSRPSIFIGHGGGSREWLELLNQLQNVHDYPVQAFETGARAGHHIRDILDGFLDESSFALLVFSKADEQKGGSVRARQNVVHEAGLFQGRLGFGRAVVLVEEGVELFSNVDGLQHISFAPGQLRNTVGEILGVLKREFPGSP